MPSFIAQLKAQLSPADWPAVVAALRQDRQLWAALESDFASRALAGAGASAAHWSPAYLALLSIEQQDLFDVLRGEPMQAVPEKLRHEAASQLEALVAEGPEDAQPALEQAARLSIALRERYRLNGGWTQLAEDLRFAGPGYWRLPLAITLGLLPNPEDLLVYLLGPEQSEDNHALALHALLSQPLTLAEQKDLQAEVCTSFDVAHRLHILQALGSQRPELGRLLAEEALAALPQAHTAKGDGLAAIERLLLQSEIHQISGKHADAVAELTAAWDAVQRFQANLASKLADSAAQSSDEVTAIAALEQAVQLDPADGRANAHLLAKKLEKGELAVADLSSRDAQHPATLIAGALAALRAQDPAEAQLLAQKALAAIIKAATQGLGAELLRGLLQLAPLFINLALTKEAKQAADLALEHNPNNAEAALWLSRAAAKRGETDEALQAAHLAAALDPEDYAVRRQLARALQAAEDYDAALLEWQSLAAEDEAVNAADWLALAECAAQSGDFVAAVEASRQAITLDAENGAAYAQLGAALLAQGDGASAVQHLERAVELAPNLLDAWLGIAAQQRAVGQFEAALATLMQAQQRCAPNAQFAYDLGQTYVALDLNDEAIAALREALELSDSHTPSQLSQAIAVALGRLELADGQQARARQTLERAHQAFPANPAIARLFGQALLAQGQAHKALAALAIADEAEPGDIAIQMDIARAHLSIDGAKQAEIVLRKVVKQDPAQLDAKVMLADALAQQGQHSQAIKQYEAILASDVNRDADMRTRLITSKAATQLEASQHEDGLATLETLQKESPEDLSVLRALCGAYRQLDRAEEAFQIAHKVYLNAGEDAATVQWYAEQAQAAGKLDAASDALAKALAANPADSPLTLALAETQWHTGDAKSAEANMKKLLTAEADVDSPLLAKAADFLAAHGAEQASIPYWTRAIQLAETPDSELYLALSKAFAGIGKLDKALETLEQSLEAHPNDARLLAKQADVLVHIERPQAALHSLDNALDILPHDADLLFSKAQLLAGSHDYATALDYAGQAVAEDGRNLGRVVYAAELAQACLQPQRAAELLADASWNAADVNLSLLSAELALDKGEEVEAAKMLAPALDMHESHPRVLALQARLAQRRGAYSEAKTYLQAAEEALASDFGRDEFGAAIQAVATAAQELGNWTLAIQLFNQAAQARSQQPRAQFALGRGLLQQAEWQQLSIDAGVAMVAERQAADTLAQIEGAFEAAGRNAGLAGLQAQMKGWSTRASLRLGAEAEIEELTASYPASAEEAAALIRYAAGRDQLKSAEAQSKGHLTSPVVLIERALAIASTDPQLAYEFAKQANAEGANGYYQAIAARLAQAAGRTEAALEHIERALALQPAQARWQALAAELELNTGQTAKAIAHLEHAADLEPEHAAHYVALGQAQMAARYHSAAVAAFEQAHKLEKNQADTLMLLAEAHRRNRDLRQAKHFALRAAKAAPHAVEPLMLQAELALQEEDGPAAKGLMENALKLTSQHPGALKILAEALKRMGKYEQAIEILEQAQKIAADPLPFLISRAQLILESRGQELGRQALQNLAERYPDRAEAFVALSQMLAAAGELHEAIQAAQQAAKQEKGLSAEESASLQLHLGQLLKHRGQLDQSLHHLDKAVEQAPNLAEAHMERGRVFLARRQHHAALNAFEMAAKAAPEQAEPHLEAALALKEAKDYATAENELRAAAKLAPKDARVQKQLAAVIALNLVHKPEGTGVAV